MLKGFIIGLALTIIIGQLPKLLRRSTRASGDFFEQLWHVLTHLGDDAVAARSLVGVALARRRARAAPLRCRSVPGSLVAVALGVVAVKSFDLDAKGVAIVGHIDSGLPRSAFRTGSSCTTTSRSVASAAGIMLVGFAEGLGAAKTYAAPSPLRASTPTASCSDSGAANFGAGLCSGMVVNGSLSKTAVNGSAGARSQLSGLIVAVLTVVTLLFLTSLFEDLPEATLAAVVIAAVIELVDIAALVDLYRLYTRRLGRIYGHAARPDFIAAVAAMLGVLVFDTLPGLFIGIAVSLLLLLYRASRPNVAELGRRPRLPGQFADRRPPPGEHAVAGVAVLRVESGLFFANADTVRHAVQSPRRAAGASAPSCSTPRRSRSSTSPRSACSTSSPTSSPARTSPSPSPTTSARYET